jgi:hypothetical protein
MAQVFAVLCQEMTPEQRGRAAEQLRALPGDPVDRRLYAALADNLDELAADGD